MNATVETPRARKLRFDDPRLLLNISQAAVELDRAARKEQAELGKAKAFFEFLQEALGDEVADGAEWSDPITVNIFTKALRDSGQAPAMRSVPDVMREAFSVVRNIDHTAEQGTDEQLAQLRDFCIAFGNSLLAYRSENRPQPPAHPYRR